MTEEENDLVVNALFDGLKAEDKLIKDFVDNLVYAMKSWALSADEETLRKRILMHLKMSYLLGHNQCMSGEKEEEKIWLQ